MMIFRNSTSHRRLLLFTLTVSFAAASVAGAPALEFRIENRESLISNPSPELVVYLTNSSDSVSAFRLHLRMNRTDLVRFPTINELSPDTTYWVCTQKSPTSVCLDSVEVDADSVLLGCWAYDWYRVGNVLKSFGSVVTEGTQVEGWPIVDAVSSDSTGGDLIVTIAAGPVAPYPTGIDFPQTEPIPLLRLPVVLADGINPEGDLTTIIDFDAYTWSDFNAMDQYGLYISPDTTFDTTWYTCGSWYGDDCIYWDRTVGPSDSMAIDYYFAPQQDPELIEFTPGTFTVIPYACGDLNGDGIGPDIGDLTYLINYLFITGPDPVHPYVSDMDGEPGTDIGDITYLICYLFIFGPDPVCP